MNVFDVDGCLTDTLPLLRVCYAAAAGADVTEDHVRKPWQEWLPDLVGDELAGAVREAKTALYLAALEQRPPRLLPAGRLALELLAAGEEVLAISAAKASVVPAVLAATGLGRLRVLAAEAVREDRPRLLAELAPTGTYYDDDRIACDLVHAGTAWTAIHV